jgi:hypothetical protein
MTTPGSLSSGGLPVGYTGGNVDIGGELEANSYWVTPTSAQLSGWLAATMDPMAASVTTGSSSLPASNAFVGGLVYLPAPVSSTGMSLFCVSLNGGTVSKFWGALVPATAGTTVAATAATAESHASIAATTPLDLAWASGPIAVPAGYYYLGYAATWATDAPTFLGGLASDTYYPATGANIVDNQQVHAENLAWSAGGFRWISQPSLTLTSSFPALTPASYVAATSLPFVGLY